MSSKHMITEKVDVWYDVMGGGDFTEPLVDFIAKLTALKDQYGESARLEFESYYESVTAYLLYEREETDKEAAARWKREEKAAAKRKIQQQNKAELKKKALKDEKLLYLSLKEKYEG